MRRNFETDPRCGKKPVLNEPARFIHSLHVYAEALFPSLFLGVVHTGSDLPMDKNVVFVTRGVYGVKSGAYNPAIASGRGAARRCGSEVAGVDTSSSGVYIRRR
jgi:hypothetical protein